MPHVGGLVPELLQRQMVVRPPVARGIARDVVDDAVPPRILTHRARRKCDCDKVAPPLVRAFPGMQWGGVMQCPRCQAQNRPGAQFCRTCGARFEALCPQCQARVEPESRFCDACGVQLVVAPTSRPIPAASSSAEPAATFATPGAYTPKHLADKILTSRSALEGERKQVSVLFVDVSGFTSLSEGLDPEDVHQWMTRVFELMLEEVHRYEGTVNQFLGDGIMALFGAPIAHEDHAQRAMHAALGIRKALDGYQEELQRKRGITFQVRQGLNTGLVVVGSIGSDLRMDYTAVGDTTNIAARLQQTADRGRVLISEATHR